MITYSIIQKSQLEGAHRLDVEYYQPEFLKIKSFLESIPHVVLGEHAFVTDGEHGSVDFVDAGVKYLTAENIQEGFISTPDPRFVSELVDIRNKRASLIQDDVIVSIKGTVGLAAIVFEEDLPANMNRDVSRIHIRNSINPFYLAAFLNSKLGRGQTLRESSGNVQQMTTLGRVRELLIPIISKKISQEIEQTIKDARKELKNSELLYQQAEELLLEELGLKDFKVEDDLSFVVNLSDVKFLNRVDADYFQPKYERIVSRIKDQNVKFLGDLVSIKKGFEPGSEAYQEDGKLFIRVSSVSKTGINDKDQKYLSDELYEKLKDDFEPKAGEILLTKDATPGIAYVLKESVGGIISGGILKLKLKTEMESEYLALCINSLVGQMQVVRDAGGSIIAHWKPDQIKNILIPILPKEVQEKIADLVRKSHEARKKSKELLEEAKRKVEEMVENAN